jgi:ABC-type glutathione transport system ATPase component
MRDSTSIAPPDALRRRCDRLVHRREALAERRRDVASEQQKLAEYLGVADAVSEALSRLSDQLFGEIITIVESQLSQALQEVLEQPIQLKVDRGFKNGVASIEFHIERRGKKENIIDGQGGSVANILSVGLRLLALTTLGETEHRRFLVLDEQDCWLHPSLVPRLVQIVHNAGKMLGFQVLMISHHDGAAFERHAEKIYRFVAGVDGVIVEQAAPEEPRSARHLPDTNAFPPPF